MLQELAIISAKQLAISKQVYPLQVILGVRQHCDLARQLLALRLAWTRQKVSLQYNRLSRGRRTMSDADTRARQIELPPTPPPLPRLSGFFLGPLWRTDQRPRRISAVKGRNEFHVLATSSSFWRYSSTWLVLQFKGVNRTAARILRAANESGIEKA